MPMVSFSYCGIGALALSCVSALPLVAQSGGGLKLDFTVRKDPISNEAQKRDGVPATLKNHQIYYGLEIELGSDRQKISVDIDTGSADMWVNWDKVDCMSIDGECNAMGSYNPDTSSTSKNLSEPFAIVYGDFSVAKGSFFTDELTFGETVVSDLQFAVAEISSTKQGGICGIGYRSLEAMQTNYNNLPYQLKESGAIDKVYYSVFLNSATAETGSVLFGGIDETKYSGELFDLDFTSDQFFAVPLVAIETGNGTVSAKNESFILDTGSEYTYFPQDVAEAIVAKVAPSATYDAYVQGLYVLDCSQVPTSGDLTYDFGVGKITIPYSDLFKQAYHNGEEVSGQCTFNIAYGVDYILGDNFLRRAYVVYDLEDGKASLAQAKYS